MDVTITFALKKWKEIQVDFPTNAINFLKTGSDQASIICSVDDDSSQNVFLHSMGASARFVMTVESDIVSGQDLPFIELAIAKAATENFSDNHKLGQGGFGTVYKVLHCIIH